MPKFLKTRKFEVTYQDKGRNKPVMTEVVEAQSESHVRVKIRATEGMVKFISIVPQIDQLGIEAYPVAG